MWSDSERGIGGIAVEGSDRVVSVRSSETDGGGMQSLRPRDRVCLTVHHGLSGARATRV
jgi:cold shock CspA family protein